MKKRLMLGVNIDHVATLRQVRGGTTPYPSLVQAAKECKAGGADQITIHLREDRRHIQDHDVFEIIKARIAPVNLELAVRDEMIDIALKAKPHIVCFVPEKREELTTEGGLNVAAQVESCARSVQRLSRRGILSSMFIEPKASQIRASAQIGAYAVEFHTGHYALVKSVSQRRSILRSMTEACELAHSLGLKVHAGHGLDYDNVLKIAQLPWMRELNIGHSIVCRSLFVGLKNAVREMRQEMKGK